MNLYKCVLIDKKGYQIESFYRYGQDEIDVLNGLELFYWPKGNWVITEDTE